LILKQVTPYEDEQLSKKEQVAQMFDNIAPKYDFLNHLLSMGVDKIWRKKAIKILIKQQPKQILDIATGTGDFAFETYAQVKPERVIGVDISKEMLLHGQQKAKQRKVEDKIFFEYGDSENLHFKDNSFEAITVAFGVRNFENTAKGLKEMQRVLTPGGNLVILEFSKPSNPVFKVLFKFYFKNILPFIGKIVSKDNRAYTYLYESVEVFPEKGAFVALMKEAGFKNCKWKALTFGICSLYTGEK